MHWNVADIFETVVDAVPAAREALVEYGHGGQRRFTFEELEARANRLAHHFLAQGVQPGDHVGFYLYNSAELLETHLAAWKIRAVPINVNYRYVEDELRYLFDNADLVAIVHGREFAPRIAAVLPSCPKLTTLVAVADGTDADLAPIGSVPYDDAIAAQSSDRTGFPERSGDDQYVLYTGGTTGMPKGVMWRQEDFFNATLRPLMALSQTAGPEPGDQAVAARDQGGNLCSFPLPPLMHGAAQWAAIISLLRGDRLVLSSARRFDPLTIWRIVAAEGVNVVTIVGDAMGRPLIEALDGPAGGHDTSSLLLIGSGGAILSPAVKEEIAARLPNVLIGDSLGASETGYQGSLQGTDKEGHPRFLMDADTTVLDDDGHPVTPGDGVVGRLARTGAIPLGYYKDAEKTAATFVEYGGRRWVLPGDMAIAEADGTITLLGRGSVSINSGGEKIFPEEVESVLKAHADIFDAVVVGVPDSTWGERVVAVVKPRDGATLELPEIVTFAKAHLASYKLPRGLVVVDEVVRSPSGKADYRWAKSVATDAPT